MLRWYAIAALALISVSSCKKENNNPDPVPTSASKIYFNGELDSSSADWIEIYSCNADGSGQQKLTNFSQGGTLDVESTNPTFSYDSTAIYFSSNKDGNGVELYRMNLDGSSIVKITAPGVASNDDSHIILIQNDQKRIYTRYNGSNAEICISNIDGTGEQKLTTMAADGYCYGAHINYLQNTIRYNVQSSASPYEMNFDGSNKHAVTGSQFELAFPLTSKIAFVRGNDLFLKNAAGTIGIQLTHAAAVAPGGSAYVDGFTFTPQGNLVYTIEAELGSSHTAQLYKVNADGTGDAVITSTPEMKFNAIVK